MMNAKMSSKHDSMHSNDVNYVSKSSKNDELMHKMLVLNILWEMREGENTRISFTISL